MTTTHHHSDVANHNGHSNIFTLMIGFIFAVSNQIFGWFNSLLDVHSTLLMQNLLMQGLQALITGGLGAFSAYMVNKALKYFEKKFKKE